MAAPAEGYVFDRWSGNASGTSDATTVTMDSDKTITACFKPATYHLSVYINPQGAGLVTPASGDFASDTQLTLTAAPSGGYAFSHWAGDASGASPTVTIDMDSDKTISACFKTTG